MRFGSKIKLCSYEQEKPPPGAEGDLCPLGGAGAVLLKRTPQLAPDGLHIVAVADTAPAAAAGGGREQIAARLGGQRLALRHILVREIGRAHV